MEIKIRNAEPEDAEGIVALIREFGVHLGQPELVTITPEKLREAVFTEDRFIELLVADAGGEIAAYAVFYPHFTSFRGQRGYYLEDIYISGDFRGHGLGKRLLGEIARMGAARGFMRIDFQVVETNHAAIAFYEKLGSLCDADERHFKFVDEAFVELQKW